jgi:hypothetical protein
MIKRELYNKYTKNIENLLDLACGKGGDLDKWVSNNIKNVVGYDINNESIKEAKRRVNNYRYPLKTNINLYVKDLSRNVINGDKNMDVITSMFAFHYFFESEDTFNVIMETIDNNLKVGGYFIGAMFDGDLIKELLNTSETYELTDKDNIKFKLQRYDNLTDSLFGNKISVYLKDTVLDEPMDEYIVYFNKFINEMNRRGFELVESELFSDLYDEKYNLNDIEKNISFLNRTFVFKKINKEVDKESKEEHIYNNDICKKETDYLMECEWNEINFKKREIVDIYKENLNKKIEREKSEEIKNIYIFTRDNFENADEIIKDINVSKKIRRYIMIVYKLFLGDVESYIKKN